jgi:hypothetical protein
MTLTDGGLGIGFWIGLINRRNQKISDNTKIDWVNIIMK